jgi:hypothetical protein
MIDLLIIAIAAAVGAAIGVSLSTAIQRAVATWLRENGLDKSVLMDAVVALERAGNRVKARVRVQARNHGTKVITMEKTHSIDDIADPQVRAELQRRGHAEQNVLALVRGA